MTYKIGDITKLTGIKVETIRYYEKIGLVASVKRTQAGYRLYDENHVKRLEFIRRSRGLGFSINSIHNLLAISDHGDTHTRAEVKQLTQQHIDAVNQKITDLQQLENALKNLSKHCDGKQAPAVDCPILNALSNTL